MEFIKILLHNIHKNHCQQLILQKVFPASKRRAMVSHIPPNKILFISLNYKYYVSLLEKVMIFQSLNYPKTLEHTHNCDSLYIGLFSSNTVGRQGYTS